MNNNKIYNIVVSTFTRQQEIEVLQRCNSVTIRNLGDVALRINGILLQPPPAPGLSGEFVSFEGNDNEYYNGRLSLVFNAGGLAPLAEITQKYYLDF
jgi:hypothetical protein